MAHLLSIEPLQAQEDLRLLRVVTNPHMVKDMQDYPDELREVASWGDETQYVDSAVEFYKKVEAARTRGKKDAS